MSSRLNVCSGPKGEDAENIVSAGQSPEKRASDESAWSIFSMDAPVDPIKESQAVMLVPSDERCVVWMSMGAGSASAELCSSLLGPSSLLEHLQRTFLALQVLQATLVRELCSDDTSGCRIRICLARTSGRRKVKLQILHANGFSPV